MLYKKFQAVAQVVGMVTIGLLAVYGLVAVLGGDLVAWASGRAAPAAADVPSVMNYQGYLRDDEGNLLNGYYTMTFAIYTTTVGGTSLWSEDLISVTVRDGYFNVLLGDTNPFLTNFFTDPDRYIGVTVAPYAEMAPRQRFASVPYAFHAWQADQADRAFGLSAADGAPADAVVVDGSGNVGIGTTPPSAKLDVNGNANVSGNATVSGTLGIGTASPECALDVRGSSKIQLKEDSTDDWVALRTDGSAVDLEFGGAPLHLFGHGLDVYLNPYDGGYVGIGTTAPTEKLDVNGNANVNGTVTVSSTAPVLIKRFENLGDHADEDTGISANDYYCVAAGWSANYDLLEAGRQDNLLWTYTKDGTWYVRVEFPSHGDGYENPDVDVVCFRKEIAEWQGAPTTLNDPDCVGGAGTCPNP